MFTYQAFLSSNTRGSPDLDTRPSEMLRSTMRAWVQRCPACGYCSRNAAEFDDQFRPVMDGSAYRSQLADARYPELASTFVCAAMLAEVIGRRDQAGWGYLHAAWTLDDANKDELARLCRDKAADMFQALLAEGHSFAAEPGASEAIVIDCLRRAGRGPEALLLIERALAQSFDENIRKILEKQRVLIQHGDTSRHLIEATVGSQTPQPLGCVFVPVCALAYSAFCFWHDAEAWASRPLVPLLLGGGGGFVLAHLVRWIRNRRLPAAPM